MQLFWTTHELLTSGRSKQRIATDVAAGRLVKVRQGLYALRAAPPDLVRAARVGGWATATTGAEQLGLWVPPDPQLHVALPHTAGRLRDPDDATAPLGDESRVCLHWTGRMAGVPSVTRIAPILIVLEHALRCLRPELAVAILDSALHLRHLRDRDLPALAASLPARLQTVALSADGRCESGIESIARYLLQRLGLHVDVQVLIDGVGRVDLLVEGRLIIELDGKQWHPDFERDRRRDTSAAIGRYRTLRFTWAQVLYDWPVVQAGVLAALAA